MMFRRVFFAWMLVWICDGCVAAAQGPFTLQQVMSAPYATSLTAAPQGVRFAWVENAEGRHNLWIGGPGENARQLTRSTEDDGQDISGLAWSPDGTLLAFAQGAENGANGRPANPAELQPAPAVQIFVVAVDGHSSQQLIGEGHAPLFSCDGRSLFFVRAGQIWTASVRADGAASEDRKDDAAPHQLVWDRGADSQLTLSPDGKTLAFVSHRDHNHSFIGVFDLQTHALRFLGASTGNDFAPAFSPESKQLAWLRGPFTDTPEFAPDRVSAVPWSLEIADVATGDSHTVFSPEANKPGSVLPHLATGEPRVLWAAGDKLIFYSETDRWLHLYALDATQAHAAPVLLTPGEFEVEDATLSNDGKTLAYASNQLATDGPKFATNMAVGKVDSEDSERRHLWRLDLTQASPKPQRITRGVGIETHPQFSADGRSLAALISDARLSMHAAAVGRDGSLTDLRPHSAPAGYPAQQLIAPQQVFFLSADKLYKLHGQLFLPPSGFERKAGSSASASASQKLKLRNDKNKEGLLQHAGEIAESSAKHPAILFFHGGPHREMLLGYPGMDYYSNAYAMNQYLASRGFIVLSVNYRCGIGYGMEFRQCEHAGGEGATEYNDVLGAVAYLHSRPDVDTARIGIWGGSYGGYLTALALARNSDLFAAGVDFHGVHEWIFEDNRADWLRGNNAQRDVIAARAHASSPMADVNRWRSPVLLIHGDNDPDVAYRQTPMLADALRARHVPVEELIFPDEVHDFLLHRDWLKSYEAAAAFFEHTLQPARVEAAQPAPKR